MPEGKEKKGGGVREVEKRGREGVGGTGRKEEN